MATNEQFSSPSPAREPGRPDDPLAAVPEKAIQLAARLQQQAIGRQSSRQKSQSARLARMVEDPPGKAFIVAMVDRIFRARTPQMAAEILRELVREHGLPGFPGAKERLLLGLAARFGPSFPRVILPMVTDRLRRECSEYLVPSSPDKFHAYLAGRKKAGFTVRVSLLGERSLGEDEATRRMDRMVAMLSDPAVQHLSVKLSAIHPRLDELAIEESVLAVREKLRRLFRAAMANPSAGPDGRGGAKNIHLDMEDARDLPITLAVFRTTLEEAEFRHLEAGMTLPAYLPGAADAQEELTAWAMARVAAGGAPIRLRLVKGAYLATDRVRAEKLGWPAGARESREAVDAQFFRMLEFATRPDHAAAVHLAVGSHNLFDIACTLVLRDHHQTTGRVEIEMLEGMVRPQAAAVREAAGGLILYAPVVGRTDFSAAIPYLLRRLDELSGEGNFLRDAHGLSPGSPAWTAQQERFRRAWSERDRPAGPEQDPRDRSTPAGRVPRCPIDGPFTNEPPTDWTLAANRTWIMDCLTRLRDGAPPEIPLVIAGETLAGPYPATGHDPSRPNIAVYTHALANEIQADRALQSAKSAFPAWAARPLSERRALLVRAAAVMARERGETIAALVMDGGKSIREGDLEVSTAVDFAQYHARAFDAAADLADVQATPLGTVVVVSPWSSPYATPCGGILAALMAGNVVIFKPAPETVLSAWLLVNHLWEAGIPREVLQFAPAPENHVGRNFIASRLADAVILTGRYETARLFQTWRPNLRLLAATSGKNAMVITATADLNQAIKDLVHSAFACAGQQCSAASLAIVEAEVYDDPVFRRQLKDAAASLKTAVAWSPGAVVTPLIRPPGRDLQRAQLTLDPGEEWLLEPRMAGHQSGLWSPGIKLGVRPGSWFHQTECFGPVLGLMRATDLDEAIRWQNESGFAFSGGIHALDPAAIRRWRDAVEVGTAHVNRPITGAKVGRQPSGGWKFSVFGPGAMPGGPNAVFALCDWQQLDMPAAGSEPRPEVLEVLQTMRRWLKQEIEKKVAEAAARSYQHFMNVEFGREQDPAGLPDQSHVFRYRPLPRGVLLRLREPFEPLFLAGAVLAAMTTRVKIELSLQRPSPFADALGIPVTIETEDELARRISREAGRYDQLRAPQGTVGEVYLAAAHHHLSVIDQPILANGRIELTHYFREQSVSESTHRHGHLRPRRSSPGN